MQKTRTRATILTRFKPQIRSMHPTHQWLRDSLPLFPFRSIIRLGSTTTTEEAFRKKTSEQRSRVREINTVESINNSSNKLLMKKRFYWSKVKTANWWTLSDFTRQGGTLEFVMGPKPNKEWGTKKEDWPASASY